MQLEPPITHDELVTGLRALGLRADDVVLVHCSLRALSGPRSMVVGGAVAVIEALQTVLCDGTLIMPAFSADCSDPALWSRPSVPRTWWPTIRAVMPAFRTDRTPTFRVGVIPEVFRKMDGVRRSMHPQSSFCAWGAEAAPITASHPLPRALGDLGPLGRMYAADARVLMLGTGWDTCTCFHLAEDRMRPAPARIRQGAPLLSGGGRRWVTWDDLDFTSRDFTALGGAWEKASGVLRRPVGRAPSTLFRMRPAVDFAVRWLAEHRPGP